jgi:DNA-directed RNA polymerase specialized sigma24 family protein
VSSTTHDIDAFRRFVETAEPRLRQALSAAVGTQAGRDATVDALGHAWENWDRVQTMANPVGYLYVTSRDRARRSHHRPLPAFYPVDESALPWVEPLLPGALERLPDRQREVVVLLHCYQWTMSEVADLLEISKTTVQNHDDRGLASLRLSMGVEV